MNRFVIAEPDKCIGCRTCEVACVVAHPTGVEEGLLMSPANFTPRLKLVKSLKFTAPVQCRHCENAPCVNVCPTNALIYSQNTVQLVVERCIGCQTCVIACPFGAMEMINRPVKQPDLGPQSIHASVSVAHKCDMCIDVESGPACISVCPTNALHLIDAESVDAKVKAKRERTAFSVPPETFQ